MASVQDLRRRIRSVRNTRKITKAFELVASARLRRAQSRIEAMRPYADRMLELMIGTARAAASVHGLPLLQRREEKTVAVVPLTGDRGLAGPFNSQILRHAFALDRSLRAGGRLHHQVARAVGVRPQRLDAQLGAAQLRGRDELERLRDLARVADGGDPPPEVLE